MAQITEQSLKDVLEVRRCLDALSAELACDRISKEQLERLKAACGDFERAVKSGDARVIAQKDVQLHDIILEATGNSRLIQLVNNLAEQMYRYRFEYIKDYTMHGRLIEEHRALYEAIRKKDRETARKTAMLHIDNQMTSITRQLNLDRALK